jgi:hypothetical protein
MFGILFTNASHSPGPMLSSWLRPTSLAATAKVESMMRSSAASGSAITASSFSIAFSIVRTSLRSMAPVFPKSYIRNATGATQGRGETAQQRQHSQRRNGAARNAAPRGAAQRSTGCVGRLAGVQAGSAREQRTFRLFGQRRLWVEHRQRVHELAELDHVVLLLVEHLKHLAPPGGARRSGARR